MPNNTVNLDAMILRDDMAALSQPAKHTAQQRTAMSILDLDGGFFATGLRKPDFQRETTHWTPQAIVDLISAFVKGDLIPAVILCQRGADTFVNDGAHRLSALIAWTLDDYGDRARSVSFFGPQLPPEQISQAEKTRKAVNKAIGPYLMFKGLNAKPEQASSVHKTILEGLRNNSLVVQWVPASDEKSAEDSFFKINQAAQPIDPTERRILKARNSANAIAARCLVRGGKGHKYWASFDKCAAEIEQLGAEIYDALFRPPIEEPISTIDIPVAGRGYNQLPFAFDLVNLCNELPLPVRSDASRQEAVHTIDTDGTKTVEFLSSVLKRVKIITTKDPGSLGLHPAVYCYAMSGSFLPNAFLAAADFANRLDKENKRRVFTEHRRTFEDYLFKNKIFISLTVTKLGSGSRSLGRLTEMYWKILEGFQANKSEEEVTSSLLADEKFSHLAQAKLTPPRIEIGRTRKMSGSTKSAVGISTAFGSVNRCGICGAPVHFRSVTIDHKVKVSDGGSADMRNGRMTHPYCNSSRR